jgi:ferredoxin--NADP+ reductase
LNHPEKAGHLVPAFLDHSRRKLLKHYRHDQSAVADQILYLNLSALTVTSESVDRGTEIVEPLKEKVLKSVFVVGAGPAGLFAAQKIALAGHEVFLFNRDIKPGGLAEYGIYPLKNTMKVGLRKQFSKVLGLPNLHYFGNVKIGSTYDITLDDLQALAPSALVVACGAQGYNKLNLPGENANGVYSAKDFVYHYNQLPPYASEDFSTGKRIAVVGMGNVAADIMRWLLEDSPARQTEEVIVVARRGPYEAKFSQKELGHVESHLDRGEFVHELDRVKARCQACDQDVSMEKIGEGTFPGLLKDGLVQTSPKLTFRFLSSPKEIIAGPDGRIKQLVVTENDLVLRADGTTGAKATNKTTILDVDTLIFAIGDKQDPGLGLPMGPDGYATRPNVESPAEPVYEMWDPQTAKALDGTYVTGWARRASTGLVGIARHDGENAAAKVIEYLKTAPEKDSLSPFEVEALLESKDLRPVNKSDLLTLTCVEEREAKARNLVSFKYSDNSEMLHAIAQEKAAAILSQTATQLAIQRSPVSEALATKLLEVLVTGD